MHTTIVAVSGNLIFSSLDASAAGQWKGSMSRKRSLPHENTLQHTPDSQAITALHSAVNGDEGICDQLIEWMEEASGEPPSRISTKPPQKYEPTSRIAWEVGSSVQGTN
jgi:hypothetical protein